jgi:signal transduction histidine kinase
LEEGLRALLVATGADGAFVDRVVDSESYGLCARTVAETNRSGADEARPFSWSDPETGEIVPGGFPYLLTPALCRSLAAGEPASIVVHRLGEGSERDLFVDMGVMQQYAVPFQIGGRWAGSLGLRRYGSVGRWTFHEVELVRVAAQLFGAAIELSLVNERMDALVRSKDELITGVAHQLRTPLTGLLGMAEILQGSEQLDLGEIRSLLDGIFASSRELSFVVDNLVVAARTDHGAVLLVPDEVELRALVDDEVRSIFGPLSRRPTVSGGPVLAWADPLRLRHAVRNLLLNALQHGGESVWMRVSGDEVAILEIGDDGPGIPKELVDSIFTKFEKGVGNGNGVPGIGLGLTVSRRLAWLMGGSLGYRDDGGSVFTLTLPLRHSGPLHRQE